MMKKQNGIKITYLLKSKSILNVSSGYTNKAQQIFFR